MALDHHRTYAASDKRVLDTPMKGREAGCLVMKSTPRPKKDLPSILSLWHNTPLAIPCHFIPF